MLLKNLRSLSKKKLCEIIESQAKEIAELKALVKKQSEYISHLEQRIDSLLRHRFGSKSEKHESPQADMFADENDEPSKNPILKKKRVVKNSSINYPKDLAVKETIVDTNNLLCRCGKSLNIIGRQITDRINYIPAKFYIDRTVYIKRACNCGDSIQVAKALPNILPIKIGNELLAQIIISKLVDRQPLYHLEQQYKARYNVTIPRANMARWMIDLADQFQPLINLMWDEFNSYDIGSLDATGIQVLKEDNRKAQTKSKVWCFIGGFKPVVLFEYNAIGHTNYLTDRLSDFKGVLHGDADQHYANLDISNCHAHNRRYYENIVKTTNKDGVASYILDQYQKLYQVEEDIKLLSADVKKQIRQKRSKPILLHMREYLDERVLNILPKSRLGKAVAYTFKHWQGLLKYLDDGRLSIDNNHTERVIRKFVVPRNNFLFCDTVRGARALCIHFSIIQTAIANNLEPYQYYIDIMKALPHCKTVDDYEALLPWNINNTQIKKVS